MNVRGAQKDSSKCYILEKERKAFKNFRAKKSQEEYQD
jgi:hypothetical protein